MADSSASTSSRPTCSTEHEDDSTDTGSSESVVSVLNLSPEREETQESSGIGTANNQAKSDVRLYFSKVRVLCVLCVKENMPIVAGQATCKTTLFVRIPTNSSHKVSVRNIPDVRSLV